ncbi:fungal pheromone STE3G-protein-coupled receptor [Schizopora paradoxa]|uniref:Fungal pheromone STE3G-protein-coupled receptor n=1 Tax=Schizopora paradoxa TaxID=27342 RepID=A0A0H2RMF9_9AGAM|nr:fungal pheromone STE3G-protein-coupled receptor [Schizopora paradoxa]
MYKLTPYPITPIGSFIGIVLSLLPLFSGVRSLSLGVWGFAIWTAVGNFIVFVNTTLWHDNVDDIAPVWCDIATKLDTGAAFGVSASSFCISLCLYKTTHYLVYLETQKQRRRAVFYELLLIIGLPILLMGLSIVIQPFRFEIVEEEGCVQTLYSYLGYLIACAPSLILSLACLVLAPLTLRIFIRQRKAMNKFLQSNQHMTRGRYNRLIVMTCMDAILNLSPAIIVIVTNAKAGEDSPYNHPFISWKFIHDDLVPGFSFSSIIQVPASEWSTDTGSVVSVKWNEWYYVAVAIGFFAIFGTNPEMRRHYRSAIWFIPEHLGVKKYASSESGSNPDVAVNSDLELHQCQNRIEQLPRINFG